MNFVKLFFNRQSVSIALISGGVVQVYLMFLAIDSMYYYSVGIDKFSPFIRAGALIAIVAVLCHEMLTRRFRYDTLLLALAAHTVISALLGFFNYGSTYIFGRHLFASITMTTSYWLGLYLSTRITSQYRLFRIISFVTAAACLLFVAVAAHDGILGRPYTNLNASIPLLFSLDAALIQGQWWLVAICLAIVLVTNLRSGVIGASIMTATYLSFRFGSRPRFKFALSPALAIILFVIASGLIIGVSKAIPQIGISERANRTFDTISAMLYDTDTGKKIEPVIKSDQEATGTPGSGEEPTKKSAAAIAADPEPKNSLLERLSTHRLSQTLSVWETIKSSWLSSLFGGFGAEYNWRYYSEPLKAWAQYTLHQSDMMIAYFLLTGGIIFAVLLTALIVWKSFAVYLNLLPGFRLGSLFVLGFGAAMFFGFQPNVPLYWILLAALSRPSSDIS